MIVRTVWFDNRFRNEPLNDERIKLFLHSNQEKSLNAYWQLHTKYTNHSQSQFYNLTYLIKISVYCQCETT